jgi:hypothetical protein
MRSEEKDLPATFDLSIINTIQVQHVKILVFLAQTAPAKFIT